MYPNHRLDENAHQTRLSGQSKDSIDKTFEDVIQQAQNPSQVRDLLFLVL